MAPINRGVAYVILAAAVTLAGCGGGLRQQAYLLHQKASFKIGDRWIIKPPHQIEATRIQLTRVPAGQDDAGVQELTVDLTTGRAAFKDVDDKKYPHQLMAGTVRNIAAGLADRSWQISRTGVPKGEQSAMVYHLDVYEAGGKVKAGAAWAVPATKPLPESLEVLTDAFNDAYRLAHPLSGDVDLLK